MDMNAVETGTSGGAHNSSRQIKFSTLVILDAEATGLQSRHTRFTELCMYAIQTGELLSHCPLRVVNKLLLCFNPQCQIDPGASRLTGLYNDSLEQMGCFKDQVQLICGFLSMQPKPICLIAHNGHDFDFPLMRSELMKAEFGFADEADIFCADSLEAFRVLDGLAPRPDWLLRKYAETEHLKNIANSNSSTDASLSSSPLLSKSALVSADTTIASAVLTSDSAAVINNKEAAASSECSAVGNANHSQNNTSTNCSTDNSKANFNKSPASSEKPTAKRSSEDEMEVSPKVAKMDCNFDSQKSITDAECELIAACDSQKSITDAELIAACDTLLSSVEVDHVTNLQAMQETTPVKPTDQTSNNNAAEQFVRKNQPDPTSASDKEKVARRLFEDTVARKSVGSSVVSNTRTSVASSASSSTLTSVASSASSSTRTSVASSASSSTRTSVASSAASSTSHSSTTSISQSNSTMPFHFNPVDVSNKRQNFNFEKPDFNDFVFLEETNIESSYTPTKFSVSMSVSSLAKSSMPKTFSLEPQSSKASSMSTPGFGMVHTTTAMAPSQSEVKLSYRLGEVYKRKFGRYPDVAHTAEDDCISLLKVIKRQASDFLLFVEQNAVPFSSVKPLW